ncbi:MAG: CsbD family protein [Caulobacterales bacterium]|nr:CsbD family protein [Caulobacterales bacterium]
MIRRLTIAALALGLMSVAACEKHEDGATQQTKGEIKEGVGGLIGDQNLKREGQKDQVVGGVKETVEDVGDAVKGDEKK